MDRRNFLVTTSALALTPASLFAKSSVVKKSLTTVTEDKRLYDLAAQITEDLLEEDKLLWKYVIKDFLENKGLYFGFWRTGGWHWVFPSSIDSLDLRYYPRVYWQIWTLDVEPTFENKDYIVDYLRKQFQHPKWSENGFVTTKPKTSTIDEIVRKLKR